MSSIDQSVEDRKRLNIRGHMSAKSLDDFPSLLAMDIYMAPSSTSVYSTDDYHRFFVLPTIPS